MNYIDTAVQSPFTVSRSIFLACITFDVVDSCESWFFVCVGVQLCVVFPLLF